MLQSKHKRNWVLEQNINPEKEAQVAVEQVMPQQKKPGRKALQIFAIIALLVLVAGGVYAWQNNRVAKLENQVADLKKNDTPTAKQTPADPYAGWKTYTTKYEKLTFKYPASFALSDTSTKASYEGLDSDRITLTGSDNFLFVMQTGLWGVGGGCENCTIAKSESIKVLNKPYYLNYVNTGDKAGMETYLLLDNNQSIYMDFINSRTIKNADGTPSLMSFTFNYQANGTDTQKPMPLSTYENDQNSANAKLVLKSLRY